MLLVVEVLLALPILMVVALAIPIFNIVTASSEEVLPPSKVRIPVVLPMLVAAVDGAVLIDRRLAPVVQALAAAAVKFRAPALFKANVPLVTVLSVRLPAVLVQEETPPLVKVKTDVALPILMAVVLPPIFNTPVESSEELLTPSNVRMLVLLPMVVGPAPGAVLIVRA